jgi:hypothetical protein
MESVKLVYKNGSYDYQKATSREMELIGIFLSSNVSSSWKSFKEFGKSAVETYTSGNTIYLEKDDNNNIILGDLYEQEKNPTVVKFDTHQYLNLLDAWGEQVWSSKPREVIIRYDNGQLSLETHA